MNNNKKTRIEKDSLGDVHVLESALYGAQSQRAVDNFNITGEMLHPMMVRSLGYVKKAVALANNDMDELDDEITKVIVQACDEIIAGDHDSEFITDAIQGGAGTSMNMNVNEVISNRASQILGENLGEYARVHPNDHANMGQSTNDVIPTAGKLTTIHLGQILLEEMESLKNSLGKKAKEFDDVIKVGRTHLQDAVLISMGQVFRSHETLVAREIGRLEHALKEMQTINLGATAIGTGINSVKGYKEKAVEHFSSITGIDFQLADDLVDGTKHIDCFSYVHSSLKTFALGLSKFANDLRMMASGPKTGLNEIHLPAKQPGSSIMPGKVNPVIAEVTNQVCFQVIGNDTTINMAVEAGQLELNVFEPVLFYNLFQSFKILTNVCNTLRINAIDDLVVNEDRCNQYVEESLAMATALVHDLGYNKVTDITAEALRDQKTLRELVLKYDLLTEEELETLFDPKSMI